MLVGTGYMRTWLNLPSGDTGPNAKLEDLSKSIQAFIEQQCYRKFEAQLYNTQIDNCYYDGLGFRELFLRQYPIWRVDQVAVDGDRAFGSATVISTDGADIIVYGEEGRVYSEAGYFTRGNQNVRVKYYAGYSTTALVGSYPLPADLRQVIVEMVVQSMKEGITAVHTVMGAEETKFIQMLSGNSMWSKTIMSYKNMGVVVGL